MTTERSSSSSSSSSSFSSYSFSSSSSSSETNKKYDPKVEAAIAEADPYRGQGTSYLHPSPLPSSSDDGGKGRYRFDPMGAVVPPLSLSRTFCQSAPGLPPSNRDPSSFGLG